VAWRGGGEAALGHMTGKGAGGIVGLSVDRAAQPE